MPDLTKLGKYEIRRELGRGAMGVVYEGYDPLIKRRVALKTIRADQLTGENAETVIARFRREAQAAGRLNHPNIVSIYDFGEDDGVWYIAMEFVEGRELKDYFQADERFPTKEIVRIMSKLLDALGYSHRLGVIHRDIKPANVILLKDGGVKVADFGIAHIESSSMTQAGTVLGTPSYMSPEQIMGLPIDGRSDLFSAAVILYQFLTGERPFVGSATATMHRVLEEDPLPPSRFNVQIPGEMDAVVRKALAKRPDDRYQTAEEFSGAIAAAAQLERTGSTEATLIAAPTGQQTRPMPAAAPAPAEPTRINEPAPAAPRDNELTTINMTKATATASPATVQSPPADVLAPASAPAKHSQTAAIAIVAGLGVVAIAAAIWFAFLRPSGDPATRAQAPVPGSGTSAQPSVGAGGGAPGAPLPRVAAAPPPKTEPGSLLITAVGLVDPKDPRYGNDKTLLQNELRADSKAQVVEKALGMMLDSRSLAANYPALNDQLLSKSGTFITNVVQESEPQVGKDGLVSMTTQAVVDVRTLQKSLNEMSRNERIEFIRAGGDPKVSVQVLARNADHPEIPPMPSPLAENLLKERIKSFGFRTWSDDPSRPDPNKQGANFDVYGEVTIKTLSMRLAASGLVVTKYALNSWTVKCVDRETGEEIYYNTTLPTGLGSWASEGEALKAIGARIGDEFSRDFFLQHATVGGHKIVLRVEGMPNPASEDLIARELVGLPQVIMTSSRMGSNPRVFDVVLSGTGADGDLVAAGVLKPLNAKLGRPCFALGPIAGDEVVAVFDKSCTDPAVLGKLETNPPAGLYGAPPDRQKAVIKDPETLRRMAI